ncbi:MAG: hypothetical protein IPP74_00300 [Alphaproteobacteria bacterium]|nr:hypothetical protein [Alphaproteobacteria bacterium]
MIEHVHDALANYIEKSGGAVPIGALEKFYEGLTDGLINPGGGAYKFSPLFSPLQLKLLVKNSVGMLTFDKAITLLNWCGDQSAEKLLPLISKRMASEVGSYSEELVNRTREAIDNKCTFRVDNRTVDVSFICQKWSVQDFEAVAKRLLERQQDFQQCASNPSACLTPSKHSRISYDKNDSCYIQR